MSKLKKSKVLLAVGGTGGHLFPAQALARDLKDVDLLFAGSGLSKNRYFLKNSFPYKEVASGTFLTSNFRRNVKGIFSLLKGFRESFKLLNEFQPDLIVGFGSFHVFPLLLAARFKKTPLILFAADTIPGKVIRFFSKKALVSALQFEEAGQHLKGKTTLVKMPFWSTGGTISKKEAREYYSLDPELLTLLIFGGSQGAAALNEAASKISLKVPFQVLHFVGHEKNCEAVQENYQKRGIRACVKAFEEKMHYAWSAADLAICRAGASTLAEMLVYEVPAILIPYPYAADDHQKVNAEIFEKKIGGALMLLETELSSEKLSSLLDELPLSLMKEKLAAFKQKEKKQDLSTLINSYL
ncbi:MAG TPA: undecaprenyldiphospho-muramoylpentapeptide beta-N-acetylglucosaminyltransferase [Rhabdochlamydiaceae bacterium]|nr:undecaprenyldiphospho-muramoylpentapeptide beta-N-acetylglucosaminyltransferase [Rhabdochlamydiaceae bacterium]